MNWHWGQILYLTDGACGLLSGFRQLYVTSPRQRRQEFLSRFDCVATWTEAQSHSRAAVSLTRYLQIATKFVQTTVRLLGRDVTLGGTTRINCMKTPATHAVKPSNHYSGLSRSVLQGQQTAHDAIQNQLTTLSPHLLDPIAGLQVVPLRSFLVTTWPSAADYRRATYRWGNDCSTWQTK
jgi:hypothetical protein